MQQRTIQLSDYQYFIEYIDAHEGNKVSQEFVMIRKFNSINEVIIDTDIFLISKDTLELLQQELKDDPSKLNVSSIVFPVPESKLSSYSKQFTDFNINLTNESFELNSGDIYELLDKNGNPINILCDKIKIYHPVTKVNQPIIFCVENYINGIHFYYICNKIENYNSESETQIERNNQIYSEYVTIYFPNFFELFKFNDSNGKGSIYYKENIISMISSDNGNFINKINANTNVKRYENSGEQLVPIGLLIQPFKIVEETITYEGEEITHNVKLYLKRRSSIENNYVSFPINLTIFPYDENDNDLYTLSNEMLSNSISLIDEYNFRLSSKLGFNNGNIAILTNFKYPNKFEFEEEFAENGTVFKSKVLQAYEYYYNVVAEEYKDFNSTEIDEISRIDNLTINDLTEYDKNLAIYALTANKNMLDEQTANSMPDKYIHFKFENIINYELFFGDLRRNGIMLPQSRLEKIDAYNCKIHYTSIEESERIDKSLTQIHSIYKFGSEKEFRYEISNLDYLLAIYKTLKKTGIRAEYEELFDSDMYFIGFKIEISTDKSFKQLIYKKYKTISIFDLNDFIFEINGIFDSWNELPETLIAKITFIDRYLNNVIVSNYIVITKEWFKYIINEGSNGKLSLLEKTNTNMKEIILDESHINFINNINCVIKKDMNEEYTEINRNSPKVIYKPIFYKVADIQNVKIRRNVKQNIGINLLNYLTKVDTFKIIIDEKEYVESMRNDAYVIFTIDAKQFNTDGGQYDIITQDDEYINTGNWSLY